MSAWQAAEPAIVLASGSVARRAVLEAAGIVFEVQVAMVDEAAVKQAARAEGASALDTAVLLAEMKARHVARRRPEALVIGCDQLLVCGDAWFDKPGSTGEARAQIQALRGRQHRLVTAIVCCRHGERVWHHVAEPLMTMRDASDGFIDAYLAAEGDSVTASVGAYRVEGLGAQLFAAIEGEHAAIMGLPLLALLGFLRQHGVLMA
jgi:septum formation protein